MKHTGKNQEEVRNQSNLPCVIDQTQALCPLPTLFSEQIHSHALTAYFNYYLKQKESSLVLYL